LFRNRHGAFDRRILELPGIESIAQQKKVRESHETANFFRACRHFDDVIFPQPNNVGCGSRQTLRCDHLESRTYLRDRRDPYSGNGCRTGLLMVNEAIYNAWAAYDATAAFILPGLQKRPLSERSNTTKSIAICHAAYTVLADLFPTQISILNDVLTPQTPSTAVTGGSNAVTLGRNTGRALMQSRYNDGSNQLDDLAPAAYSDYTGYRSVNTPEKIVDITRWQPLRLTDAAGNVFVQQFLTPHWYNVRPFALWSPPAYRPARPRLAPTRAELQELIDFSAALADTTKSLVDFWAANPGTVSPPGQWIQIAEQVSINDGNTLDEDVKLFFGVGQAVLDASIAAWDAKRIYDSVRPITAIHYYFKGKTIRAWAGPGLGTQNILGQNWYPYQHRSNPTPPFPEFVSGHSTFSGASEFVLAGLRASDGTTLKGTVKANANGVEGNTTPTQDVTFTWTSLPNAGDAAGLSRRYGGIHFEQGDLAGRNMGRAVGGLVLARCRALFEGRNVP
jgi:hypothetical protein